MNHAPFIWSAYGLSIAILLWSALSPLIRRKAAIRAIQPMRTNGRPTGRPTGNSQESSDDANT
jgi:heme exporter protein CcmD